MPTIVYLQRIFKSNRDAWQLLTRIVSPYYSAWSRLVTVPSLFFWKKQQTRAYSMSHHARRLLSGMLCTKLSEVEAKVCAITMLCIFYFTVTKTHKMKCQASHINRHSAIMVQRCMGVLEVLSVLFSTCTWFVYHDCDHSAGKSTEKIVGVETIFQGTRLWSSRREDFCRTHFSNEPKQPL
jgi:hypothetical protein